MHFTRTKKYFLGVVRLNISTFSTFCVYILDVDGPTTDLFLRKYTQHHLITHKKLLHRTYDMICMISRRASQFELQLIRDRQEGRRGTFGVRCGTY